MAAHLVHHRRKQVVARVPAAGERLKEARVAKDVDGSPAFGATPDETSVAFGDENAFFNPSEGFVTSAEVDENVRFDQFGDEGFPQEFEQDGFGDVDEAERLDDEEDSF